MGERIKLTASDGFVLNAYRAVPEGKPKGGVVVIQEVWGLNHWIRSVVDRYAKEGYVAVAPAMFDRVEFGYESDNYTPEQFEIYKLWGKEAGFKYVASGPYVRSSYFAEEACCVERCRPC